MKKLSILTSMVILFILSACVPFVIEQPKDGNVISGQSVEFSVKALFLGKVGYQWQKSANGETWVAITGATSSKYRIDQASYADNNAQFRCQMSVKNGALITKPAKLTVVPVIFVNAAATTGKNNGIKWQNAFTSLKPAFEFAEANKGIPYEIWVARGTYIPSTDVFEPLYMTEGVSVYGGFAGTETSRIQRDFRANLTVITGDITFDGKDDNNSAMIIVGASNTILDGFTIKDATGLCAMANDSASITISNCRFTGNISYVGGAAIANTKSTVKIISCSFDSNMGTITGGAVSNVNSNASIENSAFSSNKSLLGGSIYNNNANIKVAGCTIAGGEASYSGSGIYNVDSNTTIINSIIWGNVSDDKIQIANSRSASNISFSDIEGSFTGTAWNGSAGNDRGGNIDANPLFVNMLGGDLMLNVGSPCIDKGSNAGVSEGITTDLGGKARILGTVDMGAYEVQPQPAPQQ
jgi:hypothetical protein